MKKILTVIFLIFIVLCQNTVQADLTDEQGQDVAIFAQKFIKKGNARKDNEGYPILTYALTGNWGTNVKIRNAGYNEELYNVNKIAYYKYNGKYKDLEKKWCMDCGTFVSYIFKITLGLDMYLESEPWHVQDMYDDACKENGKYLYFIYKQTAISDIAYSNLKLGDIIAKVTSSGNHVMLYIGNGYVAHTNGDLITYKEPYVSGFTISKLEEYYTSSTKINVMRIKDGIIPEDYTVNSKITWPDTNEEEYILGKPINMLLEEYAARSPKINLKYLSYLYKNSLKDFYIKILK